MVGPPGTAPRDSRRILFVATTAASLRDLASWEPASVWWPWSVALLGRPDARHRDSGGTQIVPGPVGGWRGALRSVPTLGRTLAVSARASAPPRAVWALKRSRELRALLRDVDVVWGLDRAADAALSTVGGLLDGRAVLTRDQWSASRESLTRLEAALGLLATDPRATVGDGLRIDDVPSALRPLDAVADLYHLCRGRHGLLECEEMIQHLDLAGRPRAERLASGVAALAAGAELSLGLVDGEEADDAELMEVVRGTLAGADAALADGRSGRALARLGDAMALMFHRARHSEVSRTPLVEDPQTFLRPLLRSATFQALVPAQQRRQPSRERTPLQRTPRVLVVTGAYGQFHAGVVSALQGSAQVKIRDHARKHPHLGRRVLDPATLPRLAAFLHSVGRGGEPFAGEVDAELVKEAQATREAVTAMLGWADVVFSDWADPATVWVSHACPPGVRLVVRIHALDALDPWLHLTAWDRVDQVVVVSEAMRSLVTDLLGALGAQVPVVVIGVVSNLREMARPKAPEAPTTLGMLGWGRRVKDPLWALDLLERDPGWRLVLIGPGFSSSPGPATAGYVARLQERLASATVRDRVQILGPSEDVAEPLRTVGVILSTSLREGCHVGLVEGAASGAVPVVRNWPMLAGRGGPRTLYPPEWVVDDLDAAEQRIREVTQEGRWPTESARARADALRLFDPDQLAQAYRDLILGPGAAGG